MPVTFYCPSCGKAMSAEDQHAGTQARCPSCGRVTTIPHRLPVTPPASRPESGLGLGNAGLPLPKTRVSGLAIAALVLCLIPCTFPIGVVLAVTAIVRVSRSPNLWGTGLAVIGLAAGSAFVVVCAGLVVQAIIKSVELERGLQCLSNMRQVAFGLISYADSYRDCMPGNAHDSENYRWMRITGGPSVDTQHLEGVLLPYVGGNVRIYTCPTLSNQDELGGEKVVCHYAVPSILAGRPLGLLRHAYYCNPTTPPSGSNVRKLRGVPILVEPLVRERADSSLDNSLGEYDASKGVWTRLPDGAFEQGDKLATRRHGGKVNIGFHDGHAESVSFPDPEIQAQDIFFVIRDRGRATRELHMGGVNEFGSWKNQTK